eukprot:365264-Chlamydomonas_euryale.AAC.3
MHEHSCSDSTAVMVPLQQRCDEAPTCDGARIWFAGIQAPTQPADQRLDPVQHGYGTAAARIQGWPEDRGQDSGGGRGVGGGGVATRRLVEVTSRVTSQKACPKRAAGVDPFRAPGLGALATRCEERRTQRERRGQAQSPRSLYGTTDRSPCGAAGGVTATACARSSWPLHGAWLATQQLRRRQQ